MTYGVANAKTGELLQQNPRKEIKLMKKNFLSFSSA
jgi:hypothetical protein